MYANSQLWGTASDAQKKQLADKNLQLGAMLGAYGITAVRGDDGVWYIDRVGGEELFKKYKQYIYHTGGFAGEEGTVKDNEILAKLEKGEPVLTTKMWDNLTSMVGRMEQIDRIIAMVEAFASSLTDVPVSTRNMWPDRAVTGGSSTITNVTDNNRPIDIHMGDITVNAPSGDGKVIADEVRKISRENVNQIGRMLGIGR